MATRPNLSNQPKITSVGPNRKVSTGGNNAVKIGGNNVGGTGLDFKKRTPPPGIMSGKSTVKKTEAGSKGGVSNSKLSSGTV